MASAISGVCTRYTVGNSGLRKEAMIFTTDIKNVRHHRKTEGAVPVLADLLRTMSVLLFLVGVYLEGSWSKAAGTGGTERAQIVTYVAAGAVDDDAPCHRLNKRNK